MAKVGSNNFDLSHDVKMSFNMGELVPTAAIEVIPGDRFEISAQTFLRFAPLISPVMHKVRVTTDYYFVPNRILWSSWEDFITGNADVEAPTIDIDGSAYFPVGSLCDYLGYPTGPLGTSNLVSLFPLAAYLKIYDEYYRDQNLQTTEKFTPLNAGNANVIGYGDYTEPLSSPGPLRRAWHHDYFTACLPFAQKGDSVQLPLVDQGTIPVTATNAAGFPLLRNNTDGSPLTSGTMSASTSGANPVILAGGNTAYYDPNGHLTVDIQGDAVDINTVRRAFRLQEWLEKNARGGTRYVENILAHFGVKSSDARLQRPEFIGRSKQNMVISEVLATAQNETTAVGQMAGHGISMGSTQKMTFKAEEHGWIIGIVNVQPDTAYQQGLHRSYTKFDKLDYAWPTFANIGEQEVLNKEVYAASATPDATFGYIPRYSEYRYLPSRVAGEMKTSLDFWHLGRIFATEPALNEEFIECNPDHRIFAVEDPAVDKIYSHIFQNITVRRKLPRFGVPTI